MNSMCELTAAEIDGVSGASEAGEAVCSLGMAVVFGQTAFEVGLFGGGPVAGLAMGAIGAGIGAVFGYVACSSRT